MNDNVVQIGVRSGEQIAEGLEQLAADLRSGRVSARNCVVVLCDPAADEQGVAIAYFGRSSSNIEMIGLLEVAKSKAIPQ